MKFAIFFASALLVLNACSSKAPASTITQSGDLGMTIHFHPDPPSRGIESLAISVHDLANKPIEGADVELTTTMGAMNMTGQAVTARPIGDGIYSAAVEIGASTQWLFTVVAKAGSRTGTAHVAVDVK